MATKTILQIVQQAQRELTLKQTTTVTSSTDATVIKLLAFATATCDDLLKEYDAQILQTRYTFTTVDGQEEYDFPSDIERAIRGTFFDSNNRWQMRGSLTPIQWERLIVSNLATSPFERFRVFGGKIHLAPIPGPSPYTFVYEYISNNYATNDLGVPQNDFTQDSDICLFDHRLVVYGTKLKWLSSLNQDTTTALVDYQRALEFVKGSDVPSDLLSLTGYQGYRLIDNCNFPDGDFGQ